MIERIVQCEMRACKCTLQIAANDPQNRGHNVDAKNRVNEWLLALPILCVRDEFARQSCKQRVEISLQWWREPISKAPVVCISV